MRLNRPHLNRLGVHRPHPARPSAGPPSAGGAVGALAGYVAAYAPSLLPRTWLFQGVVAAVSSVFGYQVGMIAGRAAGLLGDVLGVRPDPAVQIGRAHV